MRPGPQPSTGGMGVSCLSPSLCDQSQYASDFLLVLFADLPFLLRFFFLAPSCPSWGGRALRLGGVGVDLHLRGVIFYSFIRILWFLTMAKNWNSVVKIFQNFRKSLRRISGFGF